MPDHYNGAHTARVPNHFLRFSGMPGIIMLTVAAAVAGFVSACGHSISPNQLATATLVPNQAPVDYLVPPTMISPEHGQLAKDKPFYREPHLLWTDHGLVSVFIENPPDDTANTVGWSCASLHGIKWSCSSIDPGSGIKSWGDPWLTDSRGDPCQTYGRGITMSALRSNPSNSFEEPLAYYSLDFGKTWVGPEVLTSSSDAFPVALVDGTKTLFTGRDYIAWRDFSFASGEYISQLQTKSDGSCFWAAPIRMSTLVGTDTNPQPGYDDGSDHPRLAATAEPGGVAARGATADAVLTFHAFDPNLVQKSSSIIGYASYPEDALLTCPTLTNAFECELFELGTSLMWMPSSHIYVSVYSAYDTAGPYPNSVGLWSKTSGDEGRTWSPGVQLAGPAINQSYIVQEETLAYDQVTGDMVLAYLETQKLGSYAADLKLRVMHPGTTTWTPPQTVRTLSWYWDSHGSQRKFGDYFGLQVNDGVAHVAEQYYDTAKQISYIEYFSLRYVK